MIIKILDQYRGVCLLLIKGKGRGKRLFIFIDYDLGVRSLIIKSFKMFSLYASNASKNIAIWRDVHSK